MRRIIHALVFLVILIGLVAPVFGQQPAAIATPVPVNQPAADELENLAGIVTELERAQTDIRYVEALEAAARARVEKAALLLDAYKLQMLSRRRLSTDDYEVALLPATADAPARWVVRERKKAPPGGE